MSKIKVALIGVGNCASALIQGVQYYGNKAKDEESIGLRHPNLGGYQPKDIEFTCAFDVAEGKVGKDLSEAIFGKPNNALAFVEVPKLNVKVLKGPVLDGVSEELRETIKIDPSDEVNVVESLKENNTEIAINLLPSGSTEASKRYAEEALKASCAYINATPVQIATDPEWIERYREAGLPIVGDDLTDQIGATIVHKTLLETLSKRGIRIRETYQLDVGGGTESLDTLIRTKEVKRKIKTRAVETVLPYKASVVAGSTDYVDFLGNRRDSYFWIEGTYFGRTPMRMDIRLSTVDAPNAGSVLLDVTRGVKIALDKEEAGNIQAISTYAFKNPLTILPPQEADKLFEAFIQNVKA